MRRTAGWFAASRALRWYERTDTAEPRPVILLLRQRAFSRHIHVGELPGGT